MGKRNGQHKRATGSRKYISSGCGSVKDTDDRSYTGFAGVYDELMDDAPYEEWKERIVTVLRGNGIDNGLVADLGCGTGTMTELLADAGYDMIGIDLSAEMLQVAQQKREASGHDILYLCQDMRGFELYGTVRAVVSICDSINYITEIEELTEVFRLVDNYLDPGGIFLFDFNTAYKYREVIGDATIAENREAVSFIWENVWNEEEKINEYDLTLFIREGEGYRKCVETHFQRGYEPEEIEMAIKASGLLLLDMKDAETGGAITTNTERVSVTARECRKQIGPV